MALSLSCSRILLLSYLPGLGLKRFHRILETIGSIDRLFDDVSIDLACLEFPEELALALRALIERSAHDAHSAVLSAVEAWLSTSPERGVVCIEDETYPTWLREIAYAPPVIYFEGNLKVLEVPGLAVIGSRKPTIKGVRQAEVFSEHLASEGLCVVSGLARGIDAAAHRGALQGRGPTIAVLATGLDEIYPKQNCFLAQEIIDQGGVLLTEMKLGTKARPGNFPRRNRIISGLSRGVLVVEAGLNSGSLITAKYSMEQGREVFAIPGLVDNPMAKGCHQLIKSGAKLVESVDDILEEFANPLSMMGKSAPNMMTSSTKRGMQRSNQVSAEIAPKAEVAHSLVPSEHRYVVQCINGAVATFDDLMHLAGMSQQELMGALLELELSGVVESVPGGYRLTKSVESLV